MDKIFDDILECCKKPIRVEELFSKLPYNKKQIKQAFNKLVNQGLLYPEKSKKYATLEYFDILEATFFATDKGYGFATPKTPLPSNRDIFIPEKFTKDAWHGDTVLVKLLKTRYKKDKKGDRQEGEIIRVIKRSSKKIIGTLIMKSDFYYVKPDISRFPPIAIDENALNSAKPQDKVAVKVKYFGSYEFMPHGEIDLVLGKSGDRETTVAGILYSNGIYEKFPELALKQAESFAEEISEDTFGDRLDLTNKMVFTIDGDYSKDFDDAISLEKTEDGNYLLGVHIADVSHYVTHQSPLDLEAYERGTSVYFADRVIPMLPFKLSNGICSLNPDVNRFTMSAFIKLDENANVLDYELYNSVIRSKYRLTYTNVNKVLAGEPEMVSKYSEISNTLVTMNKLAKKMEQKRAAKGALELNIPECYIKCDDDGKPVDVLLRSRGDSEKLIEQFMVLANETVAEYMDKNDIPSVYRIHEEPNLDKLKIFAEIARSFGFKISDKDLTDKIRLQDVLNQSKGTTFEKPISTMLLRSLARARYEENCIGHSGLASEFYLHFTSPIRRYPDLVVHRMLKKALDKKGFSKDDTEFVAEAATQSSDRERHADFASKDVEKIYIAEYMSKFIGESFDAYVSGVQNYGLFVELANTVEGLVRVETLEGDNYTYDEQYVRLIGKNTNKIYTIGTQVRVKLINASAVNGQIDFVLEKEEK